MKLELILEALKTLKNEWFPPVAEGQPIKVKVTAGGLALLAVMLGGPVAYYELRSIGTEVAASRTEFREFKALVWTALVSSGRVAKMEPTPSPTPPPKVGLPFRGFIPSASADDRVGDGVHGGVPDRNPVDVGSEPVGKVKE